MADYEKPEMGYPTNHQQPYITSIPADEAKRRRNRLMAYIAIGIVIFIFVLINTILAFTTTDVKIVLGDIDDVETLTPVEMSFGIEIDVKNKHWGPYKYESGVAKFMYDGYRVGEVEIPSGEVGMRSTKKVDATVVVSASSFVVENTNIGSVVESRMLKLASTAVLDGKVELLGVFEKHKSAEMRCSMVFDLDAKSVQRLECE